MTPSAYRRYFKLHALLPEKTSRAELQIRPKSLEGLRAATRHSA
jgi:hypothetical protein